MGFLSGGDHHFSAIPGVFANAAAEPTRPRPPAAKQTASRKPAPKATGPGKKASAANTGSASADATRIFLIPVGSCPNKLTMQAIPGFALLATSSRCSDKKLFNFL